MEITNDAHGETVEFRVNKDILNGLSEDDAEVYQQIKDAMMMFELGFPRQAYSILADEPMAFDPAEFRAVIEREAIKRANALMAAYAPHVPGQ